MALSDWYEVVHKGTYSGGQVALNVSHFEAQAAGLSAQDVAQAYIDTLINLYRPLQSTSFTHEELAVRNLGNPTDFTTVAFGALAGTATGDSSPTFVSLRMQFLRTRSDMKHGWKRVPGVVEGSLTGNGVGPSTVTLLEALKDAFIAGLHLAAAPAVILFKYGIIKRICVETIAGGGCVSYRLPETDAELDFYQPSTGIAHDTVGSQVSRLRD